MLLSIQFKLNEKKSEENRSNYNYPIIHSVKLKQNKPNEQRIKHETIKSNKCQLNKQNKRTNFRTVLKLVN